MTDIQASSLLLEAVIAAHLGEWECPHVELAIFETGDPSAIARTIEQFCRRHLHTKVDRAIFYQSSIGSVAGLQLRDGRRVVLKAHQPDVDPAFLDEVVNLRRRIASAGGPSPEVLVGAAPLGKGFAIVERFDDSGELCDAHRPEVRQALVRSFYEIIATLRAFVPGSGLPLHIMAPPDTLWPVPHSRLFDFDATRAGAEDIDRVAVAARSAMAPAGVVVLGHGDWRAEHVRFIGSKPAVAFDWDSLRKAPEPVLVGSTAHAFCADWTRTDHRQAPTLSEARAFVADYEQARGQPLSPDERRLCGAAFAYAVAYTARCGHSTGQDQRNQPGTFQHLIATHGLDLLEL